MDRISIKGFISNVWKRKWLIVAVVVICTIIGMGYSLFVLDEVYEATATIIVSSRTSELESVITYTDYNLNVKLTESYRALCKTSRVLSRVVTDCDLDLTVEELAKKITVTAKNNTEIIDISVQDTDPETAKLITNSLADIFQEEVVSIMKMDNVQIIDYAILPINPIKPNKTKNTLNSMVLGMMLATGIAFLIEAVDTSVKSLEQVKKILDVPILGEIPRIDHEKKKKKTLNTKKHIYIPTKNSVVAEHTREAFNKIKVNIDFATVDMANKTIVISSAVTGEGKTTVSVNTAISIANAGYKILLIDADMHQPTMHKLFGITNIQGLSGIIAHNVDWRNRIVDVDISNLHVITSGRKPPNAAELLGSNRMKEFIAEVEQEYDYIIVDAPPILPVSDVASLTKNVNTIILVVKYNYSNINALKQVQDTLKIVKAHVIGAIVTCIPQKNLEYGYGHKYGYGYGKKGRSLNNSDEKISKKAEKTNYLNEIKMMKK